MEWSTIVGLVARHVLTGAAGWLVSHGLLAADGSGNEAFIGAAMGLGAIAWSAWQKYGQVLVDKKKAEMSNLHPNAISAP